MHLQRTNGKIWITLSKQENVENIKEKNEKILVIGIFFFPALPSKGSPCLLPNPELIGKVLRTPPSELCKSHV